MAEEMAEEMADEVAEREGMVSAALDGSQLAPPLRALSSPPVDEAAVRRMWQVIHERTLRRAGQRWFVGQDEPRSTRWLVVAGALVAVLAVSLSWSLQQGWPGKSSTTGQPLVMSDGRRFESVDVPSGGAALQITLADGSNIEAEAGAHIEGLAATANEFVVSVRQGRARFSVVPGGPRRWLIETRSASVEVTGTVLSVESSDESVAVQVDVGSVLVRSPLLSNGVQRLAAGESLRLAVSDVAASNEPSPPLLCPPSGEPREPVVETELPRRSKASSAAPRGPRPATSAAELWLAADRARQAGDAAAAVEPLTRVLEDYPLDSQAALAAFTLGVLQLEQLERPREAARRFRQALELGIAAGLRESCYVRLAEALQAAGDEAGLRSVAAEYARQYPGGRQRAAMRRLLSGGSSLSAPAPEHLPRRMEGSQ